MAEYFVGITDKGKRRDHNEDTFIAREFLKKELVVACVIDGVGGYSGGEVAAAIARNVMMEYLKKLPQDIIATLQQAVVAANIKIQEEKNKNNANEQMACVLTCAVADIKHNKLYYAHVGDTRLYLLRDHSLVKLSKDHSVIGYLEESGRLSEEDAMNHPRRNEITRALGFEASIDVAEDFIETGESPFLPGDMILVCSDGLSDMISSNTIVAILSRKSSLTERARELVAAANDAGGNDNITAVLVQNTNAPVPKVALKPVERKRKIESNDPDKKDGIEQKVTRPAKRQRVFIALLVLFSAGLLSMVLFKNTEKVKQAVTVVKVNDAKPVSENMLQLLRAVIDSTKKYSLPTAAVLSNITQPILISKDSFYLNGNGSTITADTAYKGPAIVINNTARQIVLDSITFKDFDVALLVQKNNVVFKNVHFINCRVSLQYQVALPDTILTGRLKDSIFIPTLNLKKL